jgi:hypothetical protein
MICGFEIVWYCDPWYGVGVKWSLIQAFVVFIIIIIIIISSSSSSSSRISGIKLVLLCTHTLLFWSF